MKRFKGFKPPSQAVNLNDLPVTAQKQEFLNLLYHQDCVLLVGPTGSGKTTQVPQWCLEYLQRTNQAHGHIVGCTQPRRIAAMSVAQRVATERHTALGSEVGYHVRFEVVKSMKTKILYLTDGMLLREATFFPNLHNYGVILLDEAHERTLQTEILFGVVKNAIKLRNHSLSQSGDSKDRLKVVIMSASMNIDLFKNFFNAPVLKAQGRQFSIQEYVSEIPQSDLLTSTLTCVFQVHRNCDPGDILVFCSGQDEILSLLKLTRRALKYAKNQSHVDDFAYSLIALPLYASLPATQQMLVFNRKANLLAQLDPTKIGKNKKTSKNNSDLHDEDSDSCDEDLTIFHAKQSTSLNKLRRVIYATNVAETSVTIPGIKYVIDTGKVKCRQFSPETGLESLKVTNISQAQAKQRSGRAGRTCPGVCYRLYTAEDYDQMDEYPVPEIKRCSLNSVLLQLISINNDFLESFQFLERPDDERLKAALRNLLTLRAIKPSHRLSTKVFKDDHNSTKTNGVIAHELTISNATNKKLPSSKDDDSSTSSPHTSIALVSDDNSLLDFSYGLTKLGVKLRIFPLEPSWARVILAAHELGCLDEALTVISLLSVESIFHIPPSKQGQADAVLRKYQSNEGDTIMLLNVHRAFTRNFTFNRRGIKQWCLDHFIHIRNLKTARMIRKELWSCVPVALQTQTSSSCGDDTSLLRRALTYGFSNNVATMWDGKYRNKTSTKEIFIHPNSCLFKIRPECVLYTEIVETNKCYMRNCTLIDPNWVREVNTSATLQL